MSDGARRRSSASSALSLLRTVLIALGVVLMHTTLPVPTAAAHDGMPAPGQPNSVVVHHSADTPTVDVEAVAAHMPCPSGHDMVHPCIGTVTSFSALSVPTGTAELMPVLDNASGRVVAIVARAGRAPPWAVYSLDKSVFLRV